jgi:hypothetical protein
MWLTSPRWLAIAAALVLAPTGSAEQVRFRFVAADACGNLRQVAASPDGAMGERLRGLGLAVEPFPYVVPANKLATIRDPFTGRYVNVPLRLPEDTPRMEHRSDRVIFNYGSFVIVVRFYANGTVETIYNSGLLRALSFNY